MKSIKTQTQQVKHYSSKVPLKGISIMEMTLLCSSANELQQNSNASPRKEYILQILTVLILILRVYI